MKKKKKIKDYCQDVNYSSLKKMCEEVNPYIKQLQIKKGWSDKYAGVPDHPQGVGLYISQPNWKRIGN